MKKFDTQTKELSLSLVNESLSNKNDTLKTINEDKNLQSESNTLNTIDPFLNV